MAFIQYIDYAVLRVVFVGAGLKDFIFSLSNKEDTRRVEYLPGQFLDTPFSKVGIHNLSNKTLIYCLEDDGYRTGTTDIRVLSASGGNGMKTCPGNYAIFESRASIHRIRLYLTGNGSVELSLYA